MASKYSIGDRFTDGEDTYTIVDWTGTEPLLLDDYSVTAGKIEDSSVITMEWAENRGPLTAVTDPAASAAALAAYQADQQTAQAAYDALSPLEQILDGNGVYQWQQTARDEYAEYLAADAALKELQATTATALEEAARKRNQTIANMVSILGGQPAAAKALGIDQSRISRAIAALRKEPTVTFTSTDLRDQVRTATNASDGTYDVDAIVEEIVSRHGAVPVDSLDSDEFWTIVGDHAQS